MTATTASFEVLVVQGTLDPEDRYGSADPADLDLFDGYPQRFDTWAEARQAALAGMAHALDLNGPGDDYVRIEAQRAMVDLILCPGPGAPGWAADGRWWQWEAVIEGDTHGIVMVVP